QEAFDRQLLRAFVSAGWPWSSIGDPEVQALFHNYVPGAQLPSRQRLSGSLLEREVGKSQQSWIMKNSRSSTPVYATIQCDGLKDRSKKHILAFTHTVNREVRVGSIYDLSAERKTGENLYKLMEKEIEHCRDVLKLAVIGITGDAGGDERKARALAAKESPWMLFADCWAHQ
ncbi:hypothetical protein PUNSTDRAFT_16531, partial [Punctularia strigosozonata HHB-11173 SS5]|uniref:uncharacterized protein n=1 Tax=Punctularia strigosozonata (strain HHB-11173) TaxID=741275 RepID=UPI00044185F1